MNGACGGNGNEFTCDFVLMMEGAYLCFVYCEGLLLKAETCGG